MENPRLIVALIDVIDAQKMNGRLIQFLTAWSVVPATTSPTGSSNGRVSLSGTALTAGDEEAKDLGDAFRHGHRFDPR